MFSDLFFSRPFIICIRCAKAMRLNFFDPYTFPRLAYCSCELFWPPVENYLNLIQPDTLPSKLTSVLSPRGCCIGKSVPGLVSKPIELIIALVPTD